MCFRPHPAAALALMLAASAASAVDSGVTAALVERMGSAPHMRSGPVPLELTISNPLDHELTIVWGYPQVPGIQFQVTGTTDATPFATHSGAAFGPVPLFGIKAHSDYHAPIYLTRYWRFLQAGMAIVTWIYDLTVVTPKPEFITTRFTGTFSLQIVDDDPAALERQLTTDQFKVREGTDAANKVWSLQEICAITHPLAIPYLSRLATAGDSEYDVVTALLRFGDQPAARAALHDLLLITNMETTVEAILRNYAESDRVPSDADLKALLASPSLAIRYVTLVYLEGMVARLQIGRIRELAKDPNVGLSSAAAHLLKLLSTSADGVLMNSEPKPAIDPHANKF